jgi:hypothetical protein
MWFAELGGWLEATQHAPHDGRVDLADVCVEHVHTNLSRDERTESPPTKVRRGGNRASPYMQIGLQVAACYLRLKRACSTSDE